MAAEVDSPPIAESETLLVDAAAIATISDTCPVAASRIEDEAVAEADADSDALDSVLADGVTVAEIAPDSSEIEESETVCDDTEVADTVSDDRVLSERGETDVVGAAADASEAAVVSATDLDDVTVADICSVATDVVVSVADTDAAAETDGVSDASVSNGDVGTVAAVDADAFSEETAVSGNVVTVVAVTVGDSVDDAVSVAVVDEDDDTDTDSFAVGALVVIEFVAALDSPPLLYAVTA